MEDLIRVMEDGFSLPTEEGSLEGLSLFSLRIALKAYFSTARAMSGSLHIFYDGDPESMKYRDVNHSPSYWESYAETIVHFQHFAELLCKELLRKEHELLAADASNWPTILHDLLKGSQVSAQDSEKPKSVEFGVALERICELVLGGRISDNLGPIICDRKALLKKLNALRNRIWHRGTFILRYPSLDEFVGRFFLPFVLEITSSARYSDRMNVWKYRPLACGIDPLDEIAIHFRSTKYDLQKVAFLKELGRAAYSNPVRWFDREIQRQAERFADAEISHDYSANRMHCPVCGTESLVLYSDFEVDEDTGEGFSYIYSAKCTCCSFEPHRDFGNPEDHGFPIQNWR